MKEPGQDHPGATSVPLLVKEANMYPGEENSFKKEHMLPSNEAFMKPDSTNEDKNLICFNVGGKKFFVMKENFYTFPTTRLGLLVRCVDTSEILKLCDKYFEGDVPEFFFDRSWKGFNDILDVYRLGRLHLNAGGLCPLRTRASIEYWQIDELLLDPCCALKYYPLIEECDRETESQEETERKYLERIEVEDFGSSPLGRLRKFCWNLTEYPETSMLARIYAFTSMGVVVLSTVVFILSTMPELTDDIDRILFTNSTEGVEAPAQAAQERWENGILALNIIDHSTMVFFTAEFLVRLLCSPRKLAFLKSPLNIIDILAILPYYFGFILEGMKDTLVVGRVGKVLRLVRVMRILRVFKLVRHFNGLQSLLSTLGQAYKELGLLMVLLFVCVLTFSSLIYFAEKDSASRWSFPESFWWGLMVLTTVGYGEKSPDSSAGKMIGGLCALLAVFILALPVPIIVNRFEAFSENYKNRVWKGAVMMKRQDRADKEKQPPRPSKDEWTAQHSEIVKKNKVSPSPERF